MYQFIVIDRAGDPDMVLQIAHIAAIKLDIDRQLIYTVGGNSFAIEMPWGEFLKLLQEHPEIEIKYAETTHKRHMDGLRGFEEYEEFDSISGKTRRQLRAEAKYKDYGDTE
jgi:hypothetical protein